MLFLVPAPLVQPAPLPAWWPAFLASPLLASRFTQESESAVFGTLRKKGTILAGKGGRLRVAYDDGLLLVSDGETLVQYDPDARSAQRFDLRLARNEYPLLALLLDPGRVGEHFDLRPAGGPRILLKPRNPGLPEVELEGGGRAPTRMRWTDPTGAKQVLRFDGKAGPGKDAFVFSAPPGTRWIGEKGAPRNP